MMPVYYPEPIGLPVVHIMATDSNCTFTAVPAPLYVPCAFGPTPVEMAQNQVCVPTFFEHTLETPSAKQESKSRKSGKQDSRPSSAPVVPGQARAAGSTEAPNNVAQVAQQVGDADVMLTPERLVEAWPEPGTTVMLRNIPNRYTAEELLAEMLSEGFEDTFDFFYLPIDFRTKRNRGYAFINFHSSDLTKRFVMSFHHWQLTRYTTQKVLEVAPALTQGFDANVAQYIKKDSQRIQNPWFRPMIFTGPAGVAATDA